MFPSQMRLQVSSAREKEGARAVDLNEVKGRTGLSNKKWDLAIKGLRKHNLAKVEKTEEGLLVSLV